MSEAVTNCLDGEWRRDSGDWLLVPGGPAYHTVETVDCHSRDSPDDMEWAKRIDGVDWKTGKTERLLEKELVRAYLEETHETLAHKPRARVDADLLSDHAFAWSGAAVLDRRGCALWRSMLYPGQIQAKLRGRGLRGEQWH